MNAEQENKILTGLTICGLLANDNSRNKGFWETPKLYEDLVAEMTASGNYSKADFALLEAKFSRNIGEALMLVVSEAAEALECARKDIDKPAEHIDPAQFSNLEEEFADMIIRILELGYGLNLSVGAAVVAKMKYNETRPYKHEKKF